MSTLAGRKRNHQGDYSEISPSRVLHLRGLPGHTLEIDLMDVFSCFGRVKYVSMIPDSHQALLEYYDIKSSTEVVMKYREAGIALANGTIVKINYSTSPSISLRDIDDVDLAESPILGFTVYKANYPVHVELIHKIASRFGKPIKILIIRKKNIVAFVEFGSIAEAKQVKMHLNGADIYSGCCSLKVDFAPNRPLRINNNDHDQWDEQLESLNQIRGGAIANMRYLLSQGSGSLLGGSPPVNMSQNDSMFKSQSGINPMHMMNLVESMNQNRGRFPNNFNGSGGNYINFNNSNRPILSDMPFSNFNTDGNDNRSMSMASNGIVPLSPVVMVYGLNMNKINCDRIFNMLCLYGNVLKVKFLHSKEGSCMVQMGEEMSAQNLIDNFSGINLFGIRIMVHSSKQGILQPVVNPYSLPDGSPSYKEFGQSKLNRFTTRDKAAKNRICRPVSTLHFWNCPPQFTEEDVMNLFNENDVSRPLRALLFHQSEKSSSGIIEFSSAEEATNALAICNHRAIILGESPSDPPSLGSQSALNVGIPREGSWFIKLSFSLNGFKRGGANSNKTY